MRQTRHSEYGPQTRHETYSFRGLLVASAFIPLLVLLVAAPGLVLTAGLGALTALAFHRLWPAVRDYSRADPPATPARE